MLEKYGKNPDLRILVAHQLPSLHAEDVQCLIGLHHLEDRTGKVPQKRKRPQLLQCPAAHPASLHCRNMCMFLQLMGSLMPVAGRAFIHAF